MSRKISFAPGEYYHLYNRGTEKRNIFSTVADYERFLSLLYLCNSANSVHIENIQQDKSKRGPTLLDKICEVERGKPLIHICAYCLMPNHFHLLVCEKSDSGVSTFMQKLMTGYTMYFNKRHERTGALFQGQFKAQHADEDQYLRYLIAYIHLNPVKLIDPKWKESGIRNRSEAEKYLDDYRYSSYLDYRGVARKEGIIIDKDVLPAYYKTAIEFKTSLADWLEYSN